MHFRLRQLRGGSPYPLAIRCRPVRDAYPRGRTARIQGAPEDGAAGVDGRPRGCVLQTPCDGTAPMGGTAKRLPRSSKRRPAARLSESACGRRCCRPRLPLPQWRSPMHAARLPQSSEPHRRTARMRLQCSHGAMGHGARGLEGGWVGRQGEGLRVRCDVLMRAFMRMSVNGAILRSLSEHSARVLFAVVSIALLAVAATASHKSMLTTVATLGRPCHFASSRCVLWRTWRRAFPRPRTISAPSAEETREQFQKLYALDVKGTFWNDLQRPSQPGVAEGLAQLDALSEGRVGSRFGSRRGYSARGHSRMSCSADCAPLVGARSCLLSMSVAFVCVCC